MTQNKAFSALALTGALLGSVNAHALLLGEDILGQLTATGFGTLLNSTETVVDPGVEFTFNAAGGPIAADVSDAALNLFLTNNIGGNVPLGADLTWTFTLINPALIFTGVTELSDTFASGASFVGFSNGDTTAQFFIPNQTLPASSTVSATYALSVQNTAVPAPSSLALLAVGAVGGWLRRRVPRTTA